MAKNKDAELVLCVRSSVLDKIIEDAGAVFVDSFCASNGTDESAAEMVLQSLDVLYRGIMDKQGTLMGEAMFDSASTILYIPRSLCENNKEFLQIIPYTVLSHDPSVFGQWELLSYWRGTASTETRLHGNCSIGVGGHINPIDGIQARNSHGLYDVIRCCRNREVQEEIFLDWQTLVFPENECRFVGLIKDDTNDVGQVHFGVVYEHFLVSKNISPKEDALKTLEFMTVEDQKANYEFMEPWSQIVYRYLEQEERLRKVFLGEEEEEDNANGEAL